MKKLILLLITIFLAVAGYKAVRYWHETEMDIVRTELQQQYKQEQRLNEIITDIRQKNDTLTTRNYALNIENSSQNGKIQELSETIENLHQDVADLTQQIDELLTEEVFVFDAGMVQEEITNVSELATTEYRYTNVGTLDSAKTFTFIDWKVPFSDKTAIVTMDGIIKAGVDLSQVKITSDETKKTIIVTMPPAAILSNELLPDSFQVYEEKNSIWNPITLDDSNALIGQIKDKAEQNAIDNHVLEQAAERAQQVIQSIIEAVPGVRENYQIKFQTA